MAAPDPVDIRLLSIVAETGRAAVHEIAGRLGMDVREVAARLAALSTTGLPLVVGVECDPQGIRHALAAASAWTQASGPYQVPSGPYPVASGPYPPAGGPYAPQGPSGSYPVHNPAGPFPQHSGGHPVPNQHPAGYPQQQPSGSYPPPPGPAQAPAQSGPQPFTPQGPPPSFGSQYPQQGPPADTANTWGPAGSASWARGDQQPPQQARVRAGKVGSKLDIEGLEGEQVTMQLVEVVDPADFLFTAAGYQLQDGERAVVVHTEMTNRGAMPFTSLPDLYLELIATDGSSVSKAPVALSSRPPHRIGVPPGETTGGHTVYVLPDSTELSAVRWVPRPGDDQRALTWDITDL